MTTGSAVYLGMTIGVMFIFSMVLAYQSWQQARLGPDMIPDSATPRPDAQHGEPHSAVHA
ncbi:MAG TPA: hypothetical protein DDZ81_13930 [Acetobacteraceae bacterium]|nr:hypothetical protein [Acetobacteraceae bacterium]